MLTALAAAAVLAGAPTAALPAEPDWVMDSVAVHRAHKGPFLWRVSRRDAAGAEAEVWVLPTVEVRQGTAWDTTEINKIIGSARIVYTPPVATLGVGSALGLMFSGRYKLPDGATFTEMMTPDAQARYTRVLRDAHLDPARYVHDRPGFAALLIVSDLGASLKSTSPVPTVEAAARKARVKVRPAGAYDARPVVDALVKMPAADAMACLDAAIDDVAFATTHSAEAGTAWAAGDVAGVRRHFQASLMWRCLVRTGVLAQPNERSVRDTVADVKTALDQGGGALFVLGMGSFLSHDGALEALQAAGFRVDAPD